MIRVVVVDDDFRIAGIHAAYVEKVDGFKAVAQAHTAAETIAAVDRLRPTCCCSTCTCRTSMAWTWWRDYAGKGIRRST